MDEIDWLFRKVGHARYSKGIDISYINTQVNKGNELGHYFVRVLELVILDIDLLFLDIEMTLLF